MSQRDELPWILESCTLQAGVATAEKTSPDLQYIGELKPTYCIIVMTHLTAIVLIKVELLLIDKAFYFTTLKLSYN